MILRSKLEEGSNPENFSEDIWRHAVVSEGKLIVLVILFFCLCPRLFLNICLIQFIDGTDSEGAVPEKSLSCLVLFP